MEIVVVVVVVQTNQFIDFWAPWHMVEDPRQHPLLETVLLVALESIRLSACLLYPAIPQHSSRLLQRLGFSSPPPHHALRCKLTDDRVASLEKASVSLRQQQDGRPLFTKLKVTVKDMDKSLLQKS